MKRFFLVLLVLGLSVLAGAEVISFDTQSCSP